MLQVLNATGCWRKKGTVPRTSLAGGGFPRGRTPLPTVFVGRGVSQEEEAAWGAVVQDNREAALVEAENSSSTVNAPGR